MRGRERKRVGGGEGEKKEGNEGRSLLDGGACLLEDLDARGREGGMPEWFSCTEEGREGGRESVSWRGGMGVASWRTWMPEWFSWTTMKGTMLPCEHSANKANTRRGVHSDAYKTVAAASNAQWRRVSREPGLCLQQSRSIECCTRP